MKRAGQRSALRNARRTGACERPDRTAGARRFHGAIRRAHWDTFVPAPEPAQQHFRCARYGTRDMDRCTSI